MIVALILAAALTQAAPAATDENAPSITLEEKLALSSDEVKMADAMEKAQKSYLAAVKDTQAHHAAVMKEIEKEHPGWMLESGQQGWHLAKKPEQEKAPAPAKK